MSSSRFLSIGLLSALLLASLLAGSAAQQSVTPQLTQLVQFKDAACSSYANTMLQIFPPWTSGTSKCTSFTENGATYWQLEVPTLSANCQASVSVAVWANSSTQTTCGTISNTTGAIETFNVTTTNATSSCNPSYVAAAAGYTNTNLLPYFANVPASCPAPTGPPVGEIEMTLYTNSSCALGNSRVSQLFPPWTPGVPKCTEFYEASGTTLVSFYQSELVVYNSTSAGCGGTLYWSVWSTSVYSTCGSAMNSSGAIESGTVQVATLSNSQQCNQVNGTPAAESGWTSINLSQYISGYSAASACAAPAPNTTLPTNSSSSSSSSSSGVATGAAYSTASAGGVAIAALLAAVAYMW